MKDSVNVQGERRLNGLGDAAGASLLCAEEPWPERLRFSQCDLSTCVPK